MEEKKWRNRGGWFIHYGSLHAKSAKCFRGTNELYHISKAGLGFFSLGLSKYRISLSESKASIFQHTAHTASHLFNIKKVESMKS